MDMCVVDSDFRNVKDDAGGVHSAKYWEVDDGHDDESKSLLIPLENGISRSFDKGTRKVQWNDSIGNDLAKVLEFVPRVSTLNFAVAGFGQFKMSVFCDSSENDDEDSNSCLCINVGENRPV